MPISKDEKNFTSKYMLILVRGDLDKKDFRAPGTPLFKPFFIKKKPQ